MQVEWFHEEKVQILYEKVLENRLISQQNQCRHKERLCGIWNREKKHAIEDHKIGYAIGKYFFYNGIVKLNAYKRMILLW